LRFISGFEKPLIELLRRMMFRTPGASQSPVSEPPLAGLMLWAPRHTPVKSVGDYLSWIRTDGLKGTLTKGIADLLRSSEIVEF
jgi:hypothetical protein